MSGFRLRILTPDRLLYDGPCVSLTFPTPEGRQGVLARHANMEAVVVPGAVHCRLPEGETLEASVGAGFARVQNNDVLIVVDTAQAAGPAAASP